ncbi:hypothetical protein [Pseudomonas tremae]|uniref:Effector AvrPto1 n=2 Tax=Pseudomonas TaxID=286 RepID=C7DYB0_9PSED|nr:effector AvrPto1 [Pseudomonas coronafaciens pv. oryzae]MCF5715841.1 type III effector [Pseudomonas tremae]MCF5747979.1 type III effector [Pseudomonas tremae]QGL57170.1 type III effector [Pseudomonas coronafaciens pv. oryzae str. 1_6]
MGNICVGGSSMAHQVNSPDRVSNNSDDPNHVTPDQFLSVRHQLVDSSGLTREQNYFINHRGSLSLRSSHNNLYERTQRMLDRATIQHRFMSGLSVLSLGSQPHEDVAKMREYISEWSNMRISVQNEMNANSDSSESYAQITNPDGLDRQYILRPSPYGNR